VSFIGFLEQLLNFVYPQEICCTFCSTPMKEAAGVGICAKCASLLTFISDNICSICGRPYPQEYVDDICNECKGRNMHFDGGCTVFEFTGLVQEILHRLKYDGESLLATPMGMLMAYRLKKMRWDIDFIVPVPLHHERLKIRGFNQSFLMAEVVGRECGIDVLDGILIRERYTESQVNLSRLERIHNVRGAFGVKNDTKLKKKSILIVDDIMTTGATLDECSRILKENGASKVYCITAACPINIK
jgi:competence protein ComFC